MYRAARCSPTNGVEALTLGAFRVEFLLVLPLSGKSDRNPDIFAGLGGAGAAGWWGGVGWGAVRCGVAGVVWLLVCRVIVADEL